LIRHSGDGNFGGSSKYPFREANMRKVLGVAVLLFTVGCRPQVDVARETESLLQADRAWAQAAASGGSPDSVLGFWTEDARVAMAGAPLVSGKAGIRQMVTSMMAIPGSASAGLPNGRSSPHPETSATPWARTP
jgi:hypothetical protein